MQGYRCFWPSSQRASPSPTASGSLWPSISSNAWRPLGLAAQPEHIPNLFQFMSTNAIGASLSVLLLSSSLRARACCVCVCVCVCVSVRHVCSKAYKGHGHRQRNYNMTQRNKQHSHHARNRLYARVCTLTVPSNDPDAAFFPQGLNALEYTGAVCPLNILTNAPDCTAHSRTTLSRHADDAEGIGMCEGHGIRNPHKHKTKLNPNHTRPQARARAHTQRESQGQSQADLKPKCPNVMARFQVPNIMAHTDVHRLGVP